MTGAETSLLKQITARLRTSSAVVPALFAALIAMPLGVVGLAFGKPQQEVVFEIVLTAPLLVLLSQIIFFTVFDRDRLHNEEHIEKRMQIDQERSVIGDNVTKSQITLDRLTLPSSNDQEDDNE